MFNEISEFCGILQSLNLHRVLFTYKKDFNGEFLDEEDTYINGFEEIVELCDEWTEMECTESILFKFRFPELTKFYTLCKEESRKNNINFKKNPRIIKAANEVESYLMYSGASRYDFAWNLWIPKKIVNKKRYTLIVEIGMYFEDYPELLEALYLIKNYYAEQAKKLENELYPKVIKMPAKKTRERKAA